MPETTAHPSREQLSAYSLGQLPPDEAVAIESHIGECEPCCDTIISLSSDDTFVGLLKEARQLPIDQTVDHGLSPASSSGQDVPAQLAEHPRYEILGLIGKGGMGDVYKARHRKMERTVALKVVNRGLVRKAEAIDRFHREVRAAAQLSHPNIVTAYDADQAGEFHFMVMEYVDGVDLSRTIKDRGALPVAEACDYIRQAAIGLQHAHERGMVHRDIKPHNLMVTADGTVKILDFGLASLAPEAISASDFVATRSDLTAAGAIMGTPDFISPEQAEDARQADIRSDIYSLGVTLYYLLAVRVPFADGSVMHKLRSHAQMEPDSLATLRADVPHELMAIVSKMMAKDPNERYLTPSEVADALKSFLQTWQPGEVRSREMEPSGGGNMSGLGGRKASSGEAGRDWLLVLAKVVLGVSCIPVAMMFLEWCFLEEATASAGHRFWYYMLAALVLSTFAGIAFGLHRLNSGIRQSNHGDRRAFRTTASEALTVAAILTASMVTAVGYYFQNSGGVLRVEAVPPVDSTTLGTHPLTIVDTSGKKPLGGTSGTRQDDVAGITTHFFESANGRYKIELVNEFLTVNGDKYTLESPNDSIRIVDDRVEITRVAELPKDGEPLDEALPVTLANTVDNLRQIGQAVQFFEIEHGCLPSVTTTLPGAKHPVSWRVAILKYLDAGLYNQYKLDEPWDSEDNMKLLEKMPSFYRHPRQEKGITNTCYVTLVGENTATGNGERPFTGSGAAATILVTEAITNIPWTKPEDYPVDEEPSLPGDRPQHDGWNVIFGDGATQLISTATAVEEIKALIERDSTTAASEVDLPRQAISPDTTSLVWVDVRSLTWEKIDQSFNSLLDTAPPDRKERVQQLIDQFRKHARPGFAALEKGIEAGIEVLVMGERTNPANAVAADVEEALDIVEDALAAMEEGLDAEEFDAVTAEPTESKPGQLFVRMRPGASPKSAIASIVKTIKTEAQVGADPEFAQALEAVQAMEFVGIGDGWFAAKGENMLPLPPTEQTMDTTQFLRVFEKHKGAAIRFAWLMDDETRAGFDQAQLEAGVLSFGSLLTSLREMRSTSGGIWLGRRPEIALDMEFDNQEDAQLFKATIDKLVSSVVMSTAFGTEAPEEPLRAEQTRAGLSLLFLDRDGARLSKTFDIALLQRLAAAGLPWTKLFQPDEVQASEDPDVVSEAPTESIETPAVEQ